MKEIEQILNDREQSRLLLTAFQQVLDTASAMVFVKDINLVYQAVTMPFVTLLGRHTPEDVIGRTDYDIFSNEELANRYRADDLRLLKSGTNILDMLEPLPGQNGEARYASTSKYILRDHDGKEIGLLGVSRDVTDDVIARRQYQKELEYMFRLPENTYMAAFLDITAWRIVNELRQDISGNHFESHEDLDALIKKARENVVDFRGSARAFYRDFSQKTIRKIFESGQRDLVLEYLRRMPDGETRWVRDEYKLMRNPMDGHLCAMLIVRNIHEKKLEEQELIRRAERDGLTGLLNHASIRQYVKDVLEKSEDGNSHALFIIDVDNFKQINDTYGHQEGDRFLCQLADAIRNAFRSSDLVGRIGGDEYVVFMKDTPTQAIIANKAEDLMEKMMEVCKKYPDQNVSCSIGIGRYPYDGQTHEELYRRSDEALYRAKNAGKNRVCFVSEQQDG